MPAIIFAHSDLVEASPEPGATVQADIPEIRLTFSEPPSGQSSIILFGDGFELIPLTTSLEESNPNTIYAPIEQKLQLGNYTVQWTAVSEDGHEITGSYQFQVSNRPPWLESSTIILITGLFIIIATVLIWRQKESKRNLMPPVSK